jgi:hypothetical protein
MATKVHALLRASHVQTDGAQVRHDGVLLVAATPEHTQDSARELRHDGPAKRQPKPSVARVADLACAHVRPRRLGLGFVVPVDQRLDAMIRFG